jgi:hypothetical protein
MTLTEMLASLTLGLITSAVVSAVAAYVGVRVALNRIRRQTAFERRLRWCEETLTRLNEAGSAVVGAAFPTDGSDLEQAWSEAVRAYRALLPQCAQKELYANEFALKAIQQAMEAMASLLRQRAEDGEGCQEASVSCLATLQVAVTELTVEARKHLGFEPLPDSALAPAERFSGYVPPDLLDVTS